MPDGVPSGRVKMQVAGFYLLATAAPGLALQKKTAPEGAEKERRLNSQKDSAGCNQPIRHLPRDSGRHRTRWGPKGPVNQNK